MRRLSSFTALAGATLAVAFFPTIGHADAPVATDDVTLTPLGTYDGGGLARAEIVAFDPSTARMFVSNDDLVQVDIVSITDPTAPSLVTSVDLSAYGDGVNGVAAIPGLVAAAVEVEPTFTNLDGSATPQNGYVVFFDPDGSVIETVEVGVLPDAVAFSPDGTKLVVSGEAEPICAADLGEGENEDPTLAVDPEGTISVIDIVDGTPATTASVLGFGSFDTATLQNAGVRIFFPGSTAAEDLEPEYAAISDDSSTAFVTLQEANAVAVVDLLTPEITDVVALGTKDFSSLLMDPSDDDGAIALAQWDVQGMYLPDAIDAFDVDGTTFLATANEGDSRDYDCYSEEERMADLDTTGSSLDPTLLAAIGDDTLLGRLKTTSAAPTASPLDALYAFGGRSFTIWDTSGEVVWDSGSQFEEYFAANRPDYFNTQADDGAAPGSEMVGSMAAEVDSRSDDKGPEPEAVAVGRIGAGSYAFVGLERQGGVMVYDVSDPTSPVFESYVNPALDELDAAGDFTGPATTDVSPEGVFFVGAADSPTGRPLLLVSHELSGTTSVYEVTGTEIDEQLAPTPTTTVAPTTIVPTTVDPIPLTPTTVVPTGSLPPTGAGRSTSVIAMCAALLATAGAGLAVARRRF